MSQENDPLLPLAAAEDARNRADYIARQAEAIVAQHAKRIAEADAHVDALPQDLLGNQVKYRQMKDEARRKITKEFADSEDVLSVRREAHALRQKFERAAGFYGDPNKLAEVLTLGDAQRAHYASILRGAGFAQLQTLAEVARAEGNLPLAVAIGQELLPVPKDRRPVDASSLIRSTLPAPAVKKAAMFSDAVKRLYDSDSHFDRSGIAVIPPVEKIKRGLNGAGPHAPGQHGGTRHGQSSVDRISQGLAAQGQ